MIAITGHTDASMRGVADERLVRELSLQRANAVKGALGRQHRDFGLLTAMIAGMVQSGAGQAIRRNNGAAVKRELKSAVARLLQP